MRPAELPIGLLPRRRPVLRVQLALLYSGVFVGLVVVLFLASSVLFGTANVFFGHSEMAYHPGAAAAVAARKSAAGPQFTPGPLLIAVAVIAVALLAAWWLAGRFLRPLRAMTIAARGRAPGRPIRRSRTAWGGSRPRPRRGRRRGP